MKVKFRKNEVSFQNSEVNFPKMKGIFLKKSELPKKIE
jgi:hypothetical protein